MGDLVTEDVHRITGGQKPSYFCVGMLVDIKLLDQKERAQALPATAENL